MISRNSNPSATKIIFVTNSNFESLERYKLLEKYSFKPNYKQLFFLPEHNELYVGIEYKTKTKTTDPFANLDWYELGATIVNEGSSKKTNEYEVSSFEGNQDDLSNFILGMHQAAWFFDKYLDENSAKSREITVYLTPSVADSVDSESEKLIASLQKGIILAREITNEVPESLNPESIQEIIKNELGGYSSISIKTITYDELINLGMEGITFVGRASRYKPVLMHTILTPHKTVKKRICLVGKGLTYDSGGYSLKPANAMVTMKCDMAGSATMFGVIKTLAEINDLQHTEIHWISAYAENMVDGSGYKPDDILTTYAGLTVEVLNTDAEGRLTLADSLTYATLQDPDYIIDAATLTGAALMAVTENYTALMGNDAELIQSLLSTFETEKEKTVHTQMPESARETIKGSISDLQNISIPKYGGHLTAGLFLSYFVDQNLFRNKEKLEIKEPKAYSWVHLDIAGSSFNDKKNSLGVKGATGQSIRSLVKWIREND